MTDPTEIDAVFDPDAQNRRLARWALSLSVLPQVCLIGGILLDFLSSGSGAFVALGSILAGVITLGVRPVLDKSGPTLDPLVAKVGLPFVPSSKAYIQLHSGILGISWRFVWIVSRVAWSSLVAIFLIVLMLVLFVGGS